MTSSSRLRRPLSRANPVANSGLPARDGPNMLSGGLQGARSRHRPSVPLRMVGDMGESGERHPGDARPDPAEARRRLAEEGPNEIPSAKPRSLLQIAAERAQGADAAPAARAAASLYVILGRRPGGAASSSRSSSSSSASPSTRSARPSARSRRCATCRARARSSSATARSGASPGREVVRGDIILLAEGDRVPADAVRARVRRTSRWTSRCSPASRSRCARRAAPRRRRDGAARRRRHARACSPARWS